VIWFIAADNSPLSVGLDPDLKSVRYKRFDVGAAGPVPELF